VLRGAYDSLPLLPTDARSRAAILTLCARTNFDEYKRAIALAHHEIDFPAAAAHIARHEPQTLTLQKLLRTQLERRADEFGPRLSGKVVRYGDACVRLLRRRVGIPLGGRNARRCVAQ